MTFQPGIAMEYTQDLHLKMSKKIAQLTKVRLRLLGLSAGKSLRSSFLYRWYLIFFQLLVLKTYLCDEYTNYRVKIELKLRSYVMIGVAVCSLSLHI